MHRLKIWLGILLSATLLLTACNRQTPEERLEKVRQSLEQNDLLSAELEARKIVDKHPDDPAALMARMQLAQIYSKDNRLDEAATEYQAVMEQLPPTSNEGIRVLSMYNDILKRQNRHQEAIALIDKLEKENTTSPEMLMNMKVARADLNAAAGQTTEARAILSDVMEMTTNPVAQMQFRQLYLQTFARDQNTTGAVEFLKQTIADEASTETKRELVFQLTALLAETGQYEETRQWAIEGSNLTDQAVENEIDINGRSKLLLELGRVYDTIGNLEGSSRIYSTLFKANTTPSFGPYIVPSLFTVLMRKGDKEQGLEFLRAAAARYQHPELTKQVTQVEGEIQAGRFDAKDTSPQVLRFAADDPIVPKSLELLSAADTGTTGSAEGSAAAPVPASTPDDAGSSPTAATEAESTEAPAAAPDAVASTSPAPEGEITTAPVEAAP